MATQKKTTKSRNTASRSTSSRGGKRRAAPKKQPIRREIGGVVFLLLALFVGIGYFQHEALLIKWLYLLLRGLTGWGWYAAAPALLLGAWILLLHRGRPVTSHLICTLLLPVFLGSIIHISTMAAAPDSTGLLPYLWASGIALESGGALSGALAVGFHAVLGKVGTLVVFVLGFVASFMCALRLTPAAILDAVKSHEFVPYDEPEEPDEPSAERVPARSVRPARPKSAIDIPVDDPIPQANKPAVDMEMPKPRFSVKKPITSALRTSCSPMRPRSRSRSQRSSSPCRRPRSRSKRKR